MANNLKRVSDLLKEASALLDASSQASPSTSRSDSSLHHSNCRQESPSIVPSSSGNGILSATINRARNMLQTSSTSGVYSRLGRQDRLRAAAIAPESKIESKKQRLEKPFEFALIRSTDETLKLNSIIAEGIIMLHERNNEKDIRFKIKDCLRSKFELISEDDFDFVKVRRKKVYVPQLQPGTEYNYQVVRKMAGQSILYTRMKAEYECNQDDLPPWDVALAETLKEQSEKVLVDEVPPVVYIQDAENEIKLPNDKQVNDEQDYVRKKDIKFPKALFNVSSLIVDLHQEAFIDPEEILLFLQKRLTKGRDLNIVDLSQEAEGETNYVSVDRDRILETTFSELKYINDYSITFEVDFMGELARDLGGPRLEWISIMNREMKVKFFDHGLREQFAEDYFYVGVMCGISLIQGGQVPNIFPNEILDAVFSSDTFHSTCIQHLQQGFQVFGLLEIFHSFPIMQNLFKSKQHPLTAKRLMQILQPQFSEEGSSSLHREKGIYGMFVKYVREVASGRRGNVKLEDILSFVTGCSEEPILGFSTPPTISFVESQEYTLQETFSETVCEKVTFYNIQTSSMVDLKNTMSFLLLFSDVFYLRHISETSLLSSIHVCIHSHFHLHYKTMCIFLLMHTSPK